MQTVETSPVSRELEWPYANQRPRPRGSIRVNVDDFRVCETLQFEPLGSGDHLYLRIRKTNTTTRDVAAQLAQAFNVPMVAIGYAGMKDKRSVAEQWFSVRDATAESLPQLRDIETLQVSRHIKKLRRTDVAQNQFDIVVRDVNPEFRAISKRLCVPNYFGEQRFGSNGNNVIAACKWFRRGKPAINSFLRSIYISTIRSFLFNQVLAARVSKGNWNKVIAGDVVVESQATGPLWGRGRSATNGEAGDIENSALEPYKEFSNELEWLGLQQERRPLVAEVTDFVCEITRAATRLRFTLPTGTYATAVLRELIDYEASWT